jgi:acyl-CoA oxidase
MGGHAYSAYNAIPSIIADWGVMTTGGGDNVVLAQQHARYLLSLFQGNPKDWLQSLTAPSVFQSPLRFISRSFGELETELNLEKVSEALLFLLSRAVETSAQLLERAVSDSESPLSFSDAWNEHMVEILDCSRLHTGFYLVEQFRTLVCFFFLLLQPPLCFLFSNLSLPL